MLRAKLDNSGIFENSDGYKRSISDLEGNSAERSVLTLLLSSSMVCCSHMTYCWVQAFNHSSLASVAAYYDIIYAFLLFSETYIISFLDF